MMSTKDTVKIDSLAPKVIGWAVAISLSLVIIAVTVTYVIKDIIVSDENTGSGSV